MIPQKTPMSSDKRSKTKVKQSNSQRIKGETVRPRVGIQWNDVKSGFRHLKVKRWNSIGSWVHISLL